MKNRQLSLIFFLIAQLYIYVMLVCFNDIINTKVLSFVSVLLCLIISIFMHCKTKDYVLMISAISLTLISDIFMIFFNNLITISLFLMNIIQILYFLRTYLDSDVKKANILTRVIVVPIFLLIGIIVLKNRIDINSVLWIIYTLNLFINILFTIKDIGLNNFFPIGLLFLFIHSLIFMFISLENYIVINVSFISILKELSFDIRSVFYLLAQVILTCSIFTVNRRCFSKIKKEDN